VRVTLPGGLMVGALVMSRDVTVRADDAVGLRIDTTRGVVAT